MEAFQLVKIGEAKSAFQKSTLPDPVPSADDVLIDVEGFGLNYADVLARLGQYREAPPLPSVIGYEVVGRISKVGSNVESSWVGKRVVGFTRFNGYASKVVTSSLGVTAIPEDYDLVKGLAVGTQYVTAYYAANMCCDIQEGDVVLIHAAAGGVGSALIQICKLLGAEIIALAGSEEKLKVAKQNGADHVINYEASDYELEVNSILGDRKIDVTFNSTAGASFKKDFRLLGFGGKLVMYGASSRSGKKWGMLSTINMLRKMGLFLPIALLMTSKSLIGVNMLKIADHKPLIIKRCLDAIGKLLMEGKIDPIVGGEFSADQLAEAHQKLEQRATVGKIGVKW